MPLLRTDEEEARDIAAEAEHWRNYKKEDGNCLFVFFGLIASASMFISSPFWL